MSSLWLKAGALGLCLAAVAAGHFYTCEVYRKRLNLSRPPTPPKVDLIAPSRVRAARRLYVFLIDGLRPKTARQMPTLRGLAGRGWSATLRAELPALTYPGIASMATGLPPIYSGVRINQAIPPELSLDSVARRARGAGVEVRVVDQGFRPFRELLFLPEGSRFTELDQLLTEEASGRELAWVYFSGVDDAGHRSGAESDDYLTAAREADAILADLLKGLDLAQDAIVVISDHGHRAIGGHGGPEPDSRHGVFVAAGRPFVGTGDVGIVAMPRVAATLSAALGVPPPVSAIGQPILEVFGEASPRGADRLPAGERLEDSAEDARLRAGVAAILALALLGLFAAAVIRGAVKLRLRDALPALVFVVAFLGLSYIAGYPLGWSMPRGGVGYVFEMAVIGALAGALTWAVGRRERRFQEAVLAVLGLSIPYALAMAYVGTDLRWIDGGRASYLPILLGTLEFIGGVTFGLKLLIAAPIPRPTQVSVAHCGDGPEACS